MKQSLMYWFGFLGILLWFSCFTGCAAKKQFEKTQTVTDSTFYKKTVKPKDTIIKVPEVEVQTKATTKQLEEGKIFTQTKNNITSILKKEGDTITCDCKQKEYEMIFRLQNELIEVYKNRVQDSNTKETTIKYQLPWYAKILSALGLLFIIITIKRILPKK